MVCINDFTGMLEMCLLLVSLIFKIKDLEVLGWVFHRYPEIHYKPKAGNFSARLETKILKKVLVQDLISFKVDLKSKSQSILNLILKKENYLGIFTKRNQIIITHCSKKIKAGE